MFKKFLHLLLVGMLLFSSFGNVLLFAQESSSVQTVTSLPEELSDSEETAPSFDAVQQDNDIYIDTNQLQKSDEPELDLPLTDAPESSAEIRGDFPHSPESSAEIRGDSPHSLESSEEILGNSTLFSVIPPAPSLKITEVYRLGSDEWIELTNLDDKDFAGELVLTNATKKANKEFKAEFFIPAYSSVIVANKTAGGIINTKYIVNTDAKLSLTDNVAIDISLIYQGKEIDRFWVEQSEIKKYGKYPRPSFEQVFDADGERKIQMATTEKNFNIDKSLFIANPGKITLLGNKKPRNGVGPQELPSKLVISEVYFDDYEDDENEEYYTGEERIEIYNIGGGDFIGEITLSGTLFADRNEMSYFVTIPANDYLILANKNVFLLEEGVSINADYGYPEFQIADTAEIAIDLLVEQEKIDSFFVHQYRVQKVDEMMESLQKIFFPTGPIVTQATVTYDPDNPNTIKGGRQANPGLLFTFAENYKNYGLPPTEPSPPPKVDYSEQCALAKTDLFTLTEVFRGNTTYDPYLEFFLHEDMGRDYEQLLLSGSLLQTSLTLDLNDETESYARDDLEKNTRLIVAKQVGNLAEAGLLTIVYHPDFELNDVGGELEIYGINGQHRQLLDIVYLLSGTSGKSHYHNGLIRRCGDSMDIVDEFSPGFGQEVLTYFSPASEFTTKTVETVKYVGGGGGGCSCPSKEQLCSTSLLKEEKAADIPIEKMLINDDDISLLSQANLTQATGASDDKMTGDIDDVGETSSYTEGGIKILALDFKSPESITLQSFLPYDIDFTKHLYYLKSSTATTKKYIDGTLAANSIDTFTKTFGFPDKGACISLYSGDLQVDEWCYTASLANGATDETSGAEKAETSAFIPSLYQIKILDILYDPEGSDTDNETITLHNLSDLPLDLSHLKLKINTTNKKLTGTLHPGETKTFKGTFGFPNSTKDDSEVMVSLFYETTIFDTYLYNPNTPKILAQSGEVKVFSVLDGDTFRFRKEDGTLQSVRLLGVDAPESTTTRYRHTECFGTESKNYLTNLIKNQYVRLEYDATQQQVDSYGRLIAYVYIGDTLINEKMLAEGYAKEYTYKSTYEKNSTFQQAEQQAKAQKIGLRSSVTCGQSIEEVPEARGFDYDTLPLKISSLIYDPDGSDKDNEIIVLSLDTTSPHTTPFNEASPVFENLSGIDFSDNFTLTIFPRSEYSTGTTKNKSLASVGFLPVASPLELKGDRQLPNEKPTCVSLKYKNYTFDTKCYHPEQDEREEIILSGEVTDSLLPNITITSILPNPSGKDAEKEEISLLRNTSPSEEETIHLNLSSDFYLLINNKTKKKLNGILLPHQETTIKGSFSFPNTASCITLMKGSEPIDAFCYGQSKQGVRYTANNTSVQEIPQEDLALVKKITLVRQEDKLCISYNKVLFGCKAIPNSTTEKNTKLLSFQNNYIAQLQTHLRNNYSLLYHHSELRDLFDLYATTKKEIKAGSYTVHRKGEDVPLTDVASVRSIQHDQSAQEYLVSAMVDRLPRSLLAYYHQERAKWYAELMKE